MRYIPRLIGPLESISTSADISASCQCPTCGGNLEPFTGTRGERCMVHVSHEDSERCKDLEWNKLITRTGDPMRYPCLALLMAVALTGCSHGPTHWVADGPDHSHLVCNSSGLTVAETTRDSLTHGGFEVFGGNGRSYGTFETDAEAKGEAESLVSGGLTIRMGGKWLTCKN